MYFSIILNSVGDKNLRLFHKLWTVHKSTCHLDHDFFCSSQKLWELRTLRTTILLRWEGRMNTRCHVGTSQILTGKSCTSPNRTNKISIGKDRTRQTYGHPSSLFSFFFFWERGPLFSSNRTSLAMCFLILTLPL